ncbi:hypothetical protein [Brevibacterium yomogidense]|uniref:hypothetical protein n=1 Tax=Brevibacterium yomogidense TaxID=946573 RepID=UPI002FCD4AD7
MSLTPTRSLLTSLALATALVAPGAVLVPGLPGTSAPVHAAPTDDQLGADGSVLRSSETTRVAPGLDLTHFSRMEDSSWNNGNVLTADLTVDSLSVDVTDTGIVTDRAPTSEVMASGDHGGQAVAAVNGTFFDINHSDAPIYTSVSREGMRVGANTPMPSLTLTGRQAAVQMLSASGTLTADGEEHDLGGLNNPQLTEGMIGVYTAAWGDYTLDRPVGGPDSGADDVARATVVDGRSSTSPGWSTPPVTRRSPTAGRCSWAATREPRRSPRSKWAIPSTSRSHPTTTSTPRSPAATRSSPTARSRT